MKLKINAFFHTATVDKPLVIIRKRRIPLLTKFPMMKPKIDVLVFPLFSFKVLSVGSYLLPVWQSVLYLAQHN